MDHQCMTATATESELYRFKYVTGLLGASVSLLGYCLMVTTAVVFPNWRRAPQNQIWLHMCGSYLIYFCWDFYSFVYPVNDPLMSAIVDHTKIYIVTVSLFWMTSGAYLTYKNIVDVFSGVGENVMLKATLISWLLPIPCEIIMFTIYYIQYNAEISSGVKVKIACDLYAEGNMRNVLWIVSCLLGNLLIFGPILGSLCYYIRVSYSLFSNRKVIGHQRDLANTVAFGFFFVFTCCLQCVIISVQFILSLGGILNYVSIFLMSFHVSTYTTLFIVCNKMTRERWFKYLRNRDERRFNEII